ncbi:apolipoprotein N-acyltransferase [Sandarakinorhabdus sp. AAP62]|uniref:apolipoprotein N-acyltransferase n=1 Tax=Sandarakinorhabdus sp. AAP62 TaxID=1248916 RepID=UPI000316F163|nr:apolipoprotein N-acyltransferase [Sandarakinorhabdus sp. AAP62]
MQGPRNFIMATVAGSGTALAFAPLNLWPLGVIGFALLAHLVTSASRGWTAALWAWLFGTAMFAVSLNWIATAFTFQAKMPAELGWVAVVGLSMYLALFVALPAGLAARLAQKPTARALWLVALWPLAEMLRGTLLTGFAWNPAGAIWLETPVAQLASVVGGTGLSMLALACGVALLWLVRGAGRWRAAGIATLASTGVLALLGGSMISETEFIGTPLVVVQPGIGQDERYDAAAAERHLATYIRLTRTALNEVAQAGRPVIQSAEVAQRSLTETEGVVSPLPPSAEKVTGEFRNKVDAGLARPTPEAAGGGTALLPRKPTLVVWPEGAIDDLIEINPAALARLAATISKGDLLLAGGTGVRRLPDGSARYANSLFAISGDGRIVARFDKAHLVPLGEYVPWRDWLEPLGIARLVPGDFDFAAGPGPRTLALPGFTSVSPMICYEIAFPQAVTDNSNRPGWIVNVSNDAWFGAWGPPQHLAQARLRAIEERLPVARATPTGISAVVDGFGRVRVSMDQGAVGSITTSLPPPQPESLFARLGLYPVAVLVLLLALLGHLLERHRPPPPPRPLRTITV